MDTMYKGITSMILIINFIWKTYCDIDFINYTYKFH